MYKNYVINKIHIYIALIVIPIVLVLSLYSSLAHADVEIPSRYDKLSNPSAGGISKHEIGFTLTNTSTPVGSILIQFCVNSPLYGVACNFPTGMNITSATLEVANETGNTGYTIASTSAGKYYLLIHPHQIRVGRQVHILLIILLIQHLLVNITLEFRPLARRMVPDHILNLVVLPSILTLFSQ